MKYRTKQGEWDIDQWLPLVGKDDPYRLIPQFKDLPILKDENGIYHTYIENPASGRQLVELADVILTMPDGMRYTFDCSVLDLLFEPTDPLARAIGKWIDRATSWSEQKAAKDLNDLKD